MGKIIVSEFLTLDGVMESPEKWQFAYYNGEIAEFLKAQILANAAGLMGRVTYEAFAPYWPTQTNNEFGIADKLNNQPKYVVSSTLKEVAWNNSTLISHNVIAEIRTLKQQIDGIIGITGSATLIRSLMQADLVDEYQLMIHPIVLGKGLRLFNEGSDHKGLKLVDSRTFSTGVISLTYQPDRKA